jgi:hypothetical protein
MLDNDKDEGKGISSGSWLVEGIGGSGADAEMLDWIWGFMAE